MPARRSGRLVRSLKCVGPRELHQRLCAVRQSLDIRMNRFDEFLQLFEPNRNETLFGFNVASF